MGGQHGVHRRRSLVLLSGLLALLEVLQVQSRSVEFGLTAEWPTWELSPLQEAAEYLTAEKEDDHSYFWSFIDELEGSHAAIDAAAASSAYRSEEHDSIWALTLERATPLIHQLSHSLLQLYLAMRIYAPTMEVHRSLRRGAAFDQAVAEGSKSGCHVSSTSWAAVSQPAPSADEAAGEPVVVCSVEALKAVLAQSPAQTCSADGSCGGPSSSSVETFAFDHVYPSKGPVTAGAPTVVLYSVIGTSAFHAFHQLLTTHAKDGRLTYVLRHFVPQLGEERSVPTPLQGYGIYLDIKNMEYKNLDDSGSKAAEGGDDKGGEQDGPISFPADEEVAGLVFSRLAERKPDLLPQLAKLRHNLKEEADTASGTNMKVWLMKDLGLQSVQLILNARDPLRKVQDLSQNFPSHASAISSLKAKDDLRVAVLENHQSHVFGLGHTFPGHVFINGVEHAINSPIFNVFDLVKAIRDEVLLLQRIDQLPLPPPTLKALLRLAADASSSSGEDGGKPLSDVRIDIYRGAKGSLHYLNNLEKDPMYQRWPKSLQQLLFPSWQLHALARNLYTLTLVLDPADDMSPRALGVLKDTLERGFPVRLSVVLVSRPQVEAAQRNPSLLDASKTPWVEDKSGEGDAVAGDVVARLFVKAKDEHGIQAASAFLFTLSAAKTPLTYKEVVDAYSESLSKAKGGWSSRAYVSEAWKAIKTGEGREGALAMAKLVVTRGLPVGCSLLNGILTKGLDIDNSLLVLLGREQHSLARKVSEGRLTDQTKSILGALLTGPSVFTRYHPILEEHYRSTKTRPVALLGPDARRLLSRLPFLEPPASPPQPRCLSVLLSLDLSSPTGLSSLSAALRFLLTKPTKGKDGHLRLAVVHNAASSSERGAMLSHLLHSLSSEPSEKTGEAIEAMSVLAERLASDPEVHVSQAAKDLGNAWINEQLSQDYSSSLERAEELAQSLRRQLQVQAGEHAVVVNGRLVPIASVLQPEDLSVLAQVEGRPASTRDLRDLITKALATADPPHTNRSLSDVILSSQTFLSQYTAKPRMDVEAELRRLPHRQLLLDLSSSSAAASPQSRDDPVLSNLVITVVLDPLTDAARRMAPLLTVIRDHLQLPLRVLLAPDPEVLEFPLKSYYRFSLFPTRDTRVLFQSLPAQHVLTTRVDTPEPWNVQTKSAMQDLDNLRCEKGGACGDDGSQHTTAELTLKSMLVYGQCFDAKLLEPVNGLQVVLWDALNSSRRISDTLVMQNYGYFQLQAQPGVLRLSLAEGRAQELYEMVDDKGSGHEVVPGQQLMVVKKDFNHVVESLRVRKQAGKEHLPLLDDITKVTEEGDGATAATTDDSSSGVWGSLSSLWGTSGAQQAGGKAGAANETTVHVFSLATGHLYERMLKIMMLSVSKRTSVPVKFWLLENFLSPAFKEAAALMAREVGFQVEFVTYKWPDWLRQQTEKQRIIWGYKILFLDVLFPLHVKKVIYVDADQVVRADLKELWDMDLKGRPYAYTPFCTSREETLGFQFWQQGYWKNHLQGRPYHISALYVVDLARFRHMAVGDRLRAIYDQLSRDPNSLSNLDQDLPNYAQHMVPIHSLPQEWLWCESWCSDESKARAKTIDLCNNPRYKENKLDMAKRVISGPLFNESWVELDDEVKALEARGRSKLSVIA